MNLRYPPISAITVGIPRVSGGEPVSGVAVHGILEYSPRERG